MQIASFVSFASAPLGEQLSTGQHATLDAAPAIAASASPGTSTEDTQVAGAPSIAAEASTGAPTADGPAAAIPSAVGAV